MKSYKFRGWDAVGSKGWVYGDLVHNIKITKEKDLPRVMVGGYEVYPESVGLFTGFYDGEGKEIYEGDYIQSDNSFKPVEVIFGHGSFGYLNIWKEFRPLFDVFFEDSYRLTEVEVVGNKYEENVYPKAGTDDNRPQQGEDKRD